MTKSRIDELPIDDRTQLPIPWSADVLPNGRPAFSNLDTAKVSRAARVGLCGVCGESLDPWIAFLGGPVAAVRRSFIDPPMHEKCARKSLSLCPHIRGGIDVKAVMGDGSRPKRTPTDWFLYITRGFKYDPQRGFFLAAKPQRIERYTYGDGQLLPTGPVEHDALVDLALKANNELREGR